MAADAVCLSDMAVLVALIHSLSALCPSVGFIVFTQPETKAAINWYVLSLLIVCLLGFREDTQAIKHSSAIKAPK